MQLSLTNYRCFPGPNPVNLDLSNFFTALVGTNNSGKSSLLRFLYEFRHTVSFIAQAQGNLLNALRGVPGGFSLQVPDADEVFSNANKDDMRVDLVIPATACS